MEYEGSRRQKVVDFLIHHHLKLILAVIAITLAVFLVFQLAYPRDRAPLFARVNGEFITYESRNDLSAKLQTLFEQSTVTIKINDLVQQMSVSELGGVADIDSAVEQLIDYPTWERFVPFSIFAKDADISTIDIYFSDDILLQKAEVIAKTASFDPEDANLTIKDGEIILDESRSGQSISADEIRERIISSTFTIGENALEINPKVLAPKRTDADVTEVRDDAEKIVHSQTILRGPDGQDFVPDKSTVASWLKIVEDKDGKVLVGFNDKNISSFLSSINGKIKLEPGPTTVTLVDGEETSRKTGADGSEVDVSKTISRVKSTFGAVSQQKIIDVAMKTIESDTIYKRSYTSSQKGLQAYVSWISQAKNVRISLEQLTGNKWLAKARSTESIPSASTYKLFVALVLFDKINKGELHWTDSILDTNISECTERMLVASTNPCAEQFIAWFGREYINNFIYNKGFSTGTTFIHNVAIHTTAGDLMKYMKGMQQGTLMDDTNRAVLLDKLGRHPYQYGIPTGSSGEVHDKVGFLWNYVHDTGVVYHPKGTYVVAIMTEGGSYAPIAEITKELEKIMYP